MKNKIIKNFFLSIVIIGSILFLSGCESKIELTGISVDGNIYETENSQVKVFLEFNSSKNTKIDSVKDNGTIYTLTAVKEGESYFYSKKLPEVGIYQIIIQEYKYTQDGNSFTNSDYFKGPKIEKIDGSRPRAEVEKIEVYKNNSLWNEEIPLEVGDKAQVKLIFKEDFGVVVTNASLKVSGDEVVSKEVRNGVSNVIDLNIELNSVESAIEVISYTYEDSIREETKTIITSEYSYLENKFGIPVDRNLPSVSDFSFSQNSNADTNFTLNKGSEFSYYIGREGNIQFSAFYNKTSTSINITHLNFSYYHFQRGEQEIKITVEDNISTPTEGVVRGYFSKEVLIEQGINNIATGDKVTLSLIGYDFVYGEGKTSVKEEKYGIEYNFTFCTDVLFNSLPNLFSTGYYVLGEDLNLENANITDKTFNGVFDGNNFSITKTSAVSKTLFSSLGKDGIVTNIMFNGITWSGDYLSLVGTNYGTISNISFINNNFSSSSHFSFVTTYNHGNIRDIEIYYNKTINITVDTDVSLIAQKNETLESNSLLDIATIERVTISIPKSVVLSGQTLCVTTPINNGGSIKSIYMDLNWSNLLSLGANSVNSYLKVTVPSLVDNPNGLVIGTLFLSSDKVEELGFNDSTWLIQSGKIPRLDFSR